MKTSPTLTLIIATFLWGSSPIYTPLVQLGFYGSRDGDQTLHSVLSPSSNLSGNRLADLDIPDLIANLRNPDKNIRKQSALILDRQYEQDATYLRNLNDETYHGNARSRDLFSRIGSQLVRTLEDEDLFIRTTAINLFGASQIITWRPEIDPLGEWIEEFIWGTKDSQFQFSSAGKVRKSYTRWSKEAQSLLREKMPTLMEILSDEERTVRFLYLLSFLRLLLPYEHEYRDILFWDSLDEVAKFKIRELTVFPYSESFRRMIVYVREQDGLFAIEIKMPGQALDRDFIRPNHFTIAQELWEFYPHDPGVVKPLFFLGFKGKFPLYQREIEFQKYSLGLVGFLYEEGSRVRNEMRAPATTFDYLARHNNLTRTQVFQRILRDALVAGIRLHLLGYSGITQRGNDMHTENLQLLVNARVILIADFGALERVRISMEERRRQTFSLLGVRNDIDDYINQHIHHLKDILPEVVSMSFPRGSTRTQRARIAIEAIQEIGLGDHYPALMARLKVIREGGQVKIDLPTEIENKVLELVLKKEDIIEIPQTEPEPSVLDRFRRGATEEYFLKQAL